MSDKEEEADLDKELLDLIHEAGQRGSATDINEAYRASATKALAALLAYNYKATKSLAESSEKLVKGSDRLEKLTWVLIILTAVLILLELKNILIG